MSARHSPIAPDDPRTSAYSDAEVVELLRELHAAGQQLGILWGSATTLAGRVDGRILIDFGNAPVSTALNLLRLLRGAATEGPAWDS
ncbi:hypothetical protein OH807_16530 [Kitasatospora sp. NBC_01560]|uniref:hypothetical protein n=1 Tax=Kitasatospora sp. NBC_01560 TaxID=2975965 RepID=UPI003866A5B6